jgi:predicted nucleotidyltransferase
MYSFIENKLNEIVALCKQHKVKSISLFGSAAKNKMNPKSDVDFLVNFSDDINLLDYADNYFSLLDGLKQIFNKEIDLITEKSIKNPILKEEIFKTKIDLYAA